jgi:hypothetical protein
MGAACRHIICTALGRKQQTEVTISDGGKYLLAVKVGLVQICVCILITLYLYNTVSLCTVASYLVGGGDEEGGKGEVKRKYGGRGQGSESGMGTKRMERRYRDERGKERRGGKARADRIWI